jgi:hypothetical protein
MGKDEAMDAFENEHMVGMDMMEGYEVPHVVKPTSDAPFIEYWMWHDGKLVPATPEELEWIHEREREREALWRLKQWQRWQQPQPRDARWQSIRAAYTAVTGRLAIWRRGTVRAATSPARTEAIKEKRVTRTEG